MSEVYLITGGAGSIGSNLVKQLARLGEKIIILDNLSAYPFDYYTEFGLRELDVELIDADLSNKRLLRDLIPKVDRIVHLAALADVGACTRNPRQEFDTNIIGTQNLLDIAVKSHVKKFTFISSASVYGSIDEPLEKRKFSERSGCFPISNYGLSKLWGEQRTLLYSQQYGLPGTALRLFSVYGSPQIPKYGSHSWCVAIFAMQLKLGKAITVFGDGEQIRDFVHVRDIAEAIRLATILENSNGKIINIGSGNPTSINELCDLTCRLTNSRKNIRFLPLRKDDPLGCYADTSLSNSILGWKYNIALEEGIKEYLYWLDNHEHLIPKFI